MFERNVKQFLGVEIAEWIEGWKYKIKYLSIGFEGEVGYKEICWENWSIRNIKWKVKKPKQAVVENHTKLSKKKIQMFNYFSFYQLIS